MYGSCPVVEEGDGWRRLDRANDTKVFLNIVLDDAVEEKDGGEKVKLGMVVRPINHNPWLAYMMLEALERIGGGREDRG